MRLHDCDDTAFRAFASGREHRAAGQAHRRDLDHFARQIVHRPAAWHLGFERERWMAASEDQSEAIVRNFFRVVVWFYNRGRKT